MAKDKRFERVYSQDLGSTIIYVDRETGVNYLFVANGYAGGLTPLLDREGKPVVTPIINK
ncbi:MAG: xylan 1,4-beta-xylosidase [Clostridia bacterium]|nr:xylan 1,4-beta-xylosidase [Clostridia bacterium]